MDTTKKNIDTLFIERNENHRQAPRQSLFDEISAELDSPKKQESNLRILRPILSIAAGLALVVSVFFVTQLYNTTETSYKVADLELPQKSIVLMPSSELYSAYKINDPKAWLQEYQKQNNQDVIN